MAEPQHGRYTWRMWLWIAGAFAVVALALLFYYAPFRSVEPKPRASPASIPSGWYVEPEGPKVPVTLPETRMKNVPAPTPAVTGEKEPAR